VQILLAFGATRDELAVSLVECGWPKLPSDKGDRSRHLAVLSQRWERYAALQRATDPESLLPEMPARGVGAISKAARRATKLPLDRVVLDSTHAATFSRLRIYDLPPGTLDRLWESDAAKRSLAKTMLAYREPAPHGAPRSRR
jgi:hypothetical protein